MVEMSYTAFFIPVYYQTLFTENRQADSFPVLTNKKLECKKAGIPYKGVFAMTLSNFARIGKGVITKAIGLQENYIIVYEKTERKLDEQKSGCSGCPVFETKCRMRECGIEDAADYLDCQCEGCSQAEFTEFHTESKKYINEKNRFGYQQTLKSNPVKLLLAYHFMQPDSIGMVKDVSIKELAALVGCTTDTIRANNKILQDYGYISICNSGLFDGCINVMLMEYKDYHKTAEEGGTGYITMSASMLDKILGINGINPLRINLKGILEVDNASYRNTEDPELSSATATFKKLQGFLPGYCKRSVIINALRGNNSIIDFEYDSNIVTFKINPEFAQKNMRGSMLADEAASMEEYIKNLNKTLGMAGEVYIRGASPLADARLAGYRIAKADRYIPLPLSDKDYRDLASMCVQYDRSLVQKAVISAYNGYTLQGKEINNFGGLVRTIIRSFLYAEKVA